MPTPGDLVMDFFKRVRELEASAFEAFNVIQLSDRCPSTTVIKESTASWAQISTADGLVYRVPVGMMLHLLCITGSECLL